MIWMLRVFISTALCLYLDWSSPYIAHISLDTDVLDISGLSAALKTNLVHRIWKEVFTETETKLCNITNTSTATNPTNTTTKVKTSHTNHLYRSTPSLYRPAFHNSKIKSTEYSLYFGKSCNSTTSLNGPHEFTPAGGRFREFLLYYYHY